MIRFLTLGTTELSGDDSPAAFPQVIAQPKRLALLAYLAVSRPGCRHYRDTLLALLWPDLDTGSARHALRQALYHLRKELGEGVVLGGNQPGVFVDPERLWCDAVAFEEALAHGRLEIALELYRGEFLPGLYADGGPDFEQWVDSVREHLQAEAVAAAWALTDQAQVAGDFREACAWARRIVALEPCDEGGGRRLIRLLAATGQRSEALQVYEALAARLKRMLGLEPVPETRALAAAVREGAPDQFTGHYRSSAGDGRRSRNPAAKPVLAVLPFADLNGSGAADAFANGLTEMVITELARRECSAVSVLSRTSVRQYRSRDCPIPVIARELGAAFVLEGSVLVEDGHVRVTGQLLAVTPERHLWAESFDRHFADLLELQARLAETMADRVTAVLCER
ncbi:MAG: BTAD domain-containing putative transcriptional regulator [Gemmatimonadota bacterium]